MASVHVEFVHQINKQLCSWLRAAECTREKILRISVHIVSISLNIQNLYLCRGRLGNNDPFLSTIAILRH